MRCAVGCCGIGGLAGNVVGRIGVVANSGAQVDRSAGVL
jgi:hypothetical protein